MKKILSFFLAVLILAVSGVAFASTDYAGVLSSDETAIDFLEGYWTNGRSDYIFAARGEGSLISWMTNLPYTSEHIYVLEDGILKGKSLNEKSEIVETGLLSISITDENTIRVKSLISGDETKFTRDSFVVDTENLDPSYVFRTMDRAAVFLSGDWMTENLDYFFFTTDETGMPQLVTNLPCTAGDSVDFCDGKLCAITVDEKGKKAFDPAYGFTILDRDTILVECFTDGLSYRFIRTDAAVDPENLDSEYVFSCDSRAYAFLEGEWADTADEHHFGLENDNGNVSWKTDFPLDEHYSYVFAGGSLIGIDFDENGDRILTRLFSFRVISKDKLEIRTLSDNSVYYLNRA